MNIFKEGLQMDEVTAEGLYFLIMYENASAAIQEAVDHLLREGQQTEDEQHHN